MLTTILLRGLWTWRRRQYNALQCGIILRADLVVWPSPALSRVVLKADPHKVVLFAVINQKVTQCLPLWRVEGKGGRQLNDRGHFSPIEREARPILKIGSAVHYLFTPHITQNCVTFTIRSAFNLFAAIKCRCDRPVSVNNVSASAVIQL